MKQLSRLQSALFLAGGLLMVAGAAASFLGWAAAPYVFALGAMLFVPMQMLQRYEGRNITILRLRRILLVSDVLFLATALLMVASRDNILGLPQIFYVQYVYNKWVATLLLAAVIQLYAVHRLDYELAKDAKKTLKV